jgi:hypothetical protein
VDSWNFYGPVGCSSLSVFIGRKQKDGFETPFVFDDYVQWSITEAVTANSLPTKATAQPCVGIFLGTISFIAGLKKAGVVGTVPENRRPDTNVSDLVILVS